MKTPFFCVNNGQHGGTTFCQRPRQLQRGLTMVELLVALVVSLLISLAAISALIVTRQGFTTVDASSQLRDNGRFAADLIQRLGVQSGFKDVFYTAKPASPTEIAANIAANIAPNVYGFNNATSSSSDPLNSSTTRTAGSLGYGSDILILRFQEAETFPDSGVSDGSMIDCAGYSSTVAPVDRNDRKPSILHVSESPANSGELALMCTYLSPTTGNWDTQPIVQGVENFQVLYGTDGVTAGTAPPTNPASAAATMDSVPDRYLRADQLTVAGDATGTYNNWDRVRSIRIGMVLRGPLNSAQDKVSQTLYPLGLGKATSGGAVGSALSSSNDPGTVVTTPVDGRLRQVYSFTVHLRNTQGI